MFGGRWPVGSEFCQNRMALAVAFSPSGRWPIGPPFPRQHISPRDGLVIPETNTSAVAAVVIGSRTYRCNCFELILWKTPLCARFKRLQKDSIPFAVAPSAATY